MRKSSFIIMPAVIGLLVLAVCCSASPSYLGISGNIFTPDDKVLTTGQFSAEYHQVRVDSNIGLIGAEVGITPKMELGILSFDSNADGSSTRTGLNMKYLMHPETAASPSVVIGSVDTTGALDVNSNPSLFLMLGKNLTPAATGIAGEPMKPIRGYLGFGSGVYNGPFVAMDWQFSARASVIVEYVNKLRLHDSFDGKSVFSAGLRMNIIDNLKGDISLIDGNNLGFGLTYNKSL